MRGQQQVRRSGWHITTPYYGSPAPPANSQDHKMRIGRLTRYLPLSICQCEKDSLQLRNALVAAQRSVSTSSPVKFVCRPQISNLVAGVSLKRLETIQMHLSAFVQPDDTHYAGMHTETAASVRGAYVGLLFVQVCTISTATNDEPSSINFLPRRMEVRCMQH